MYIKELKYKRKSFQIPRDFILKSSQLPLSTPIFIIDKTGGIISGKNTRRFFKNKGNIWKSISPSSFKKYLRLQNRFYTLSIAEHFESALSCVIVGPLKDSQLSLCFICSASDKGHSGLSDYQNTLILYKKYLDNLSPNYFIGLQKNIVISSFEKKIAAAMQLLLLSTKTGDERDFAPIIFSVSDFSIRIRDFIKAYTQFDISINDSRLRGLNISVFPRLFQMIIFCTSLGLFNSAEKLVSLSFSQKGGDVFLTICAGYKPGSDLGAFENGLYDALDAFAIRHKTSRRAKKHTIKINLGKSFPDYVVSSAVKIDEFIKSIEEDKVTQDILSGLI